jgi:hypothetical protein
MPNPSRNSGVIMSSDLTFITNEQGQHLGDRFGVLLGDDTRFLCESLGKLESLLDRDLQKFTTVFIDESHRFRTEDTQRRDVGALPEAIV